ncbi:MAG: TlpA disulfide reductase family protein [Bryobacteraceae bacterium]|jgi:thiol-disulfide isomerase/thioredoxin
MRLALVFLAVAALRAGDVEDLVARIKALAAREAPRARADTLDRLSGLMGGGPVEFASRLDLPGNVDVQRLVEEVEHNGDDPAAYLALAAVIRERQLSAGQDSPSIRARVALLDLDELLNPVLLRLDGTRVRLNDYRGKRVLLAFWATWCVPCRAELARLEAMAPGDFAVLAISREPLATVRTFLEKHPSKLPMFIDAGHKLGDRLGVDTIPKIVALEPSAAGFPLP